MKTLFWLFLPFVLLAQQASWPDTIVMKGGNVFPCLVNELQKSTVSLIYGQREEQLNMGLIGVEKIVLAEHGLIFQADSGLRGDLGSVQEFISLRQQNLEQEQKQLLAQQKALELAEKRRQEEEQILRRQQQQLIDTTAQTAKCTAPYRWSFGVLYIPYSSGTIYVLEDYNVSPSLPYVYSRINDETKMEGHLAFLLLPRLRLTCDLGYSRTYARQAIEEHVRYTDDTYQYDDGIITTSDLKLFSLSIGCKYYLSEFKVHKVSPYLLAGAGKQFALVTDKSEALFVEEPSTTRLDDNIEEYLEDLNSPPHVFLGFGVEYFFNESLSLFANARFYYSWTKGHYEYRQIQDTRVETGFSDYKNAELIKRVGLGFNFYF